MAACQLLLCADNLASQTIYPGHAVTADEEPLNYEAVRVADGRRDVIDRWQPSTANADHYVRIACDQLRAANFIALDRNGNHKGYRYQLIGADVDDVTKGRTIWDITIPTVPGGTIDGAYGCLTGAGEWFKAFPVDAHSYWFLVSKAMGAGLVPRIVGLWLGVAWRPTGEGVHYPPLHDLSFQTSFVESSAPSGWAGRGRAAVGRVASVDIKMLDESNDDPFEFHVMSLYLRGRAMWCILRTTEHPERGFLARIPQGLLASEYNPLTWYMGRTARLQLLEEQPVP